MPTSDYGFLPPEILLSAIVDSSEDAIVSKNLNSIVTSWNKGAERIFGYTADEMVGTSIAQLFPPDRWDEEALILEKIQSGKRVEHFETVRIRKDGVHLDASLTISPIKLPDGTIVGASKIARDITAQKKSSRELISMNEALGRANHLKSEFVATLSHELRTPLNAIVGWIHLLKTSTNHEEMMQGVDVIERNIKAQSRLIDDLLDMSRIEAGKISLDVQKLDVAEVIQAAVDTVRPSAQVKGIRLTTTFASIDGILMGDKSRLQQIIWNLLTNAVKFTPKGGRIHVVSERINSHVEISVADSGKGISQEHLDLVFDRFRQVDASTTRQHGGLGLGLSIARHLAELHGGTLEVSSLGLGQGSTFTLHLPLMSSHPSEKNEAAEARNAEIDKRAGESDLSGIRVLAIDDEADSLEVVLRVLSRARATVHGALSMSEALDAFAEFRPHVVLSDIGMPEHDGYEFITRLRALPDGGRVPAVALTALARSEDRTRALRAGFQMHVAKPVDSLELVAVVKNLAALQGFAQ